MQLPKNRAKWTKEHKDYYWSLVEQAKPRWKNNRSDEVKHRSGRIHYNPSLTSTQKQRKKGVFKEHEHYDLEA